MSIYFETEDIALPELNYSLVCNVIKSFLRKEKKLLGELSYIFCSDNKILEINQQFLNHDYFTDIITFDYVEGRRIAGDIFISLERVQENSKNFNQTPEDELLRVIFHGLLHLMGYDDHLETDIIIMRKMEQYLINLFKARK